MEGMNTQIYVACKLSLIALSDHQKITISTDGPMDRWTDIHNYGHLYFTLTYFSRDKMDDVAGIKRQSTNDNDTGR